MQNQDRGKHNRWFFLLFCALTGAVVVAFQSMSLSVLLPEISDEFNMTVTQAGLLWGIGALPSIFSSLLVGNIIDRYGAKNITIIGCFLLGLLGAARGLSPNFFFLLVITFLFGLFLPLITISNIKFVRNRFESIELSKANGIISLGMALGFFAGSMFSASFITPLVGGWRNTFFLYGIVSIVLMIPWFFTTSIEDRGEVSQSSQPHFSGRQNIKHVITIRKLWLLGLTFLCLNGAVQGLLGYIPLYLRNLGWGKTNADALAASFHLASMVCVIPITLIADKLSDRKKLVLILTSVTAVGIAMFSIFNGGILWMGIIAAGFARDAIMAILFAMTMDTNGLDIAYAGIATGFMMVFISIGSLFSPPLGNSIAKIAPNLPFVFWCILCFIGLLSIRSLKSKTKDYAI